MLVSIHSAILVSTIYAEGLSNVSIADYLQTHVYYQNPQLLRVLAAPPTACS